MKPNEQPKVSVCMLAHNNAEYVAQAIDSVLSQKVDFAVELVIGEDCSTDGAAEIIKSFKSNGNFLIRPHYNKKNIGLVKNLHQTLQRCTGEYIAYLDNDDYWIDDEKLKLQVNFLDANREYAICYHPSLMLRGWKIGKSPARNVPVTSSILDLAESNYIHSNTILFRSSAFHGFPPEYFESPVNDYFLLMLVAQHGLIGRIEKSMAVYRIHDRSDWSSRKNQDLHILQYLECMIGLFNEEVNKTLIARHQRIALEALRSRLNEPELSDRIGACLKYGDQTLRQYLKTTNNADVGRVRNIIKTIRHQWHRLRNSTA